MSRISHPAGPADLDLGDLDLGDLALADLAIDDERDLSTARIFTLLSIASALFWGGLGFVLYAIG